MDWQTADTIKRSSSLAYFIGGHLLPVIVFYLQSKILAREKKPNAWYYLPVALFGTVLFGGLVESIIWRGQIAGGAGSYEYEFASSLGILLALFTYRISLKWCWKFLSRKTS